MFLKRGHLAVFNLIDSPADSSYILALTLPGDWVVNVVRAQTLGFADAMMSVAVLTFVSVLFNSIQTGARHKMPKRKE